MRKITLVLILLLSFCTHFTLSAGLPVSLRWSGMGQSGLALSDTPDAFSVNPAALFRIEPTLFSVDIGYQDFYQHPAADAYEILPFLNNPSNQFDFTFATPYSALSVALDYSLNDRTYVSGDQSVSYTGYNDSLIRLNLAYGNDVLSVGAYAEGGSTLIRPITIDQSSAVVDYFSQVFLSRYYPAGMLQTFTTGIGVLATYPYFSFGLMTDSLFGYDHDTNEITFDLQSMVEKSSVGFAFSTEKYDSDVQLSRYVFSSALDLTDLGDTENRAIHFGAELKLQFLKDFYLAVQGGYYETRPSPDSFFGFSWEGTTTFGLSLRYHDMYVNSAVNVPSLWFSGGGVDEQMSAVVSLSYVF